MKSDLNASHFSFKDWGTAVSQDVIKDEMHLQKRKPCTDHPSLLSSKMTRHMTLEPPATMEEMPIVPQRMNPSVPLTV
jgi:hypothetical protein